MSKIGHLESKIDVLETEISILHEMLLAIGFPKGIYTLKEAVYEFLSDNGSLESDS
ncbi:MAG: hypothetical protein JW769_01885 [Parachlamydiales bacterium]|nr:hypothetical protein [Parachlamydiales bacterium]